MIQFNFGSYVIRAEPNTHLSVRDEDSPFHFSGTPGGLIQMLDQAGYGGSVTEEKKCYWVAGQSWLHEKPVREDEKINIRVIGEDQPTFRGTVKDLVEALKLGNKAALLQAQSAAHEMGSQTILVQNMLNAENGNLRVQNRDLKDALARAGKACEEAATALIARDAQLMAKDAEIASLKSANEYMERRLEKYRRLDDISMEMKTSLREDNERLRKELASLLDAACTHRYYESRLRDELSKAIDQAATSLAK